MDTTNAQPHTAKRYAHLCILLASSCMLVACQKSEVVPTTAERLKSIPQAPEQATQPEPQVPRKWVDYMSDLKSRKDKPPVPAPPAVEPAAPPTAKPVNTKPAFAETKSVAPTVATPAAAPVQAAAAPTAPAANVVASAAPTSRPVPPKEVASTTSVITREPPEFPREAQRAGVESGSVRARLTINAAGEVSNVVILEAKPLRVFDRSVIKALSRWKFNPGGDARTYDTEIVFKL